MSVLARTPTVPPRRLDLLAAMSMAVVSALLAVPAALAAPDGAIQWVIEAHGALTYTAVGVVILSRRPGHRIGRLTLGIGLAFSTATIFSLAIARVAPGGPPTTIDPGTVGLALVVVLATALPVLGLLLGATLLIAWFPDGRRTSRLGGLVEGLVAIGMVAAFASALTEPAMVLLGESAALRSAFTFVGGVVVQVFAVGFLVAVVDLTLRYRRADRVRRVQMRWVMAAVALTFAATATVFLFGDSAEWLWVVWIASATLPIVGVAIAITRYHLYDIDRIVSRSISYAVVTMLLFVTFAGVALLMQSAIGGAVAGPGSPLDPRVVAASTLVVAALFNPVRTRVQRTVDRRFHRTRYDAERIVGGFAGRLRGNLDLPTLTGELRRTTVEAIEPSATAVWLRSRP